MVPNFGKQNAHCESKTSSFFDYSDVHKLSSHLDAVRTIAFHPTELCLASGSDDNTIKLWRMDVTTLASSA